MQRSSLQIGPSRYKLKKHKWNAKVLGGSRGYHCDNNTIGLEKGLPKDMEAEVFMHEILHGIYYTFNLGKIIHEPCQDEVEESFVSAMSTALCTVFVQNPWLLTYFQKAFRK